MQLGQTLAHLRQPRTFVQMHGVSHPLKINPRANHVGNARSAETLIISSVRSANSPYRPQT